MAFPELPLGPGEFVQGAVRYSSYYPGDEPNRRIVVPVSFDNAPRISQVVVDTGSPWCVLNPTEARELNIDISECPRVPTEKGYNIRGQSYPGWLCKIPIRLEVDEGTGITIDTTVFIPELVPGAETWDDKPNFLGLTGLEEIRFAINPESHRFYFGA
jgi:hypothetical protein